MPQILQPRTVEPAAWRRWARQGLALAWRTAACLLPVCLVLGLSAGLVMCINEAELLRRMGVSLDPGAAWILRDSGLLSILGVMGFGLWQVALFEVMGAAAEGRRVNAGMLWTAIHGFWTRQGPQARQQMRVRAFFIALLVVLLMSINATIVLALPPEDLLQALAKRESQTRPLLFLASSAWGSVVLLCWTFQRQSCVSLALPLVRRHDLPWDVAHRLATQALVRNWPTFRPLRLLFLAFLITVAVVPGAMLAVFVLELVWVAILVVAYRDLFEAKTALAPAPARAAAPVARPVLG